MAGIDTDVLAAAREHVQRPDLRGTWFELGGSSMGAARLVSQLRKQGIRLKLAQLLKAESVHDLLTEATRT